MSNKLQQYEFQRFYILIGCEIGLFRSNCSLFCRSLLTNQGEWYIFSKYTNLVVVVILTLHKFVPVCLMFDSIVLWPGNNDTAELFCLPIRLRVVLCICEVASFRCFAYDYNECNVKSIQLSVKTFDGTS